MGRVLSINESDKKGTVKLPRERGFFLKDSGLINDAHSGNWHRQVSLLGMESIDKLSTSYSELKYGSFAENITTQGIILYELPIGTILLIGDSIQRVTQIGKECHDYCDIKKIIGSCVMPREGIFTEVIKSGWVNTGDEIKILDSFNIRKSQGGM